MKTCDIIISSNNLHSLKCFLLFCFYIDKNVDSLSIKSYFEKKRRSKILTMLKSPHINKKAQEQFEQRIFIKRFRLYSQKLPKLVILFKEIKNEIFPDIQMKILFSLHIKDEQNIYFNFNNVRFNVFSSELFAKKALKVIFFIKILDIYGEFIQRNANIFVV